MNRLSLLFLFTLTLCTVIDAQPTGKKPCICMAITVHTGMVRQYFSEPVPDTEHRILPEHKMLGTSWGTNLTLHRPSRIYYGLDYSHLTSVNVRRKIRAVEPWDRTGGRVESDFLAGSVGYKLMRPSRYWRAMIEGSLGLLWTYGNMGFVGQDVTFQDRSLAAKISPTITYLFHEKFAIGLKSAYLLSSYSGDFSFHREGQDKVARESRRIKADQWSAHLSFTYLMEL